MIKKLEISKVQELIKILDAAGDKMKDLKEDDVLKLVDRERKTMRHKNAHYSRHGSFPNLLLAKKEKI